MHTSVAPRSQASATRRATSSMGTTYAGPRAASDARPLEKAQKPQLRVQTFV
jgi:hypothetical protein